ncbi:sigma-54 dependent transcriptional regulator [Geomonas sp. Red69]|uniref:Sigma-54 dependent transcriptional regulator n=1 Tax=Geomonas diazotrophica TaxID=2843197 RepID=A0ABX8JNQ1_9BACT|nr:MULTISPECIES: sigma-54 dependent transcriptional regulator [Geomonas]MBU5636475.1 sigma-54 dependent transcriptional regulator [Geomonas diazotrophica]QWV99022.1 sigma-54 dependent transcriptional regulator [Geomonas nitrogeniifigens]QXE88188.1 sigma-54 dependent transcriptional regulator [Geomonas nitrogeniifigens]
MRARILVVDDELSMREFLAILLDGEGYLVDQAESAEHALACMADQHYDMVISDVSMPGLGGIDLLTRIKADSPDTAVLLITAFTTAEQAVEAMKLGAYDYIGKPFKVEEVKVLVRKALEKRSLVQENKRLKAEVQERFGFSGLIGKSKQMREVYDLIAKVADSMANVLITGESGTGKELAARAIHYNSPRRNARFEAVNCGAIPETLIESELFGHMKGAFTGAITDRPGLFEQAEGGTLFLDEIGEVPLQLQAKLLRVLQEREFRRVGGGSALKADVRIVAASNRNLEEQVREGTFREDLFYRLNVVEVRMPSLRERSEDIPLLIEHFYKKYAIWSGTGDIVTPDALLALFNYPFPGNVRELENLVERCVVLGSRVITAECLPPSVRNYHIPSVDAEEVSIPADGMDLQGYLDNLEQRLLVQALERSGGVKKRAAALLGMTFRSFRYRLAKFGMEDD